MKKITFPMLLATVLVAASCSNEDVTNVGTENGKDLIWFGSANNSVTTRAGFGASTRIVAQIVSEPRTGSDPSTAKYTKAVLTADADATQSTTTYSKVGYATGYNNKYWDDAHGRYSRLSVYAVAIPSQTTKTVDGAATNIIADDKLTGSLTGWEATTAMKNTIAWGVSSAQTATELNQEDLTYSNNIQTTGDNGCYIWNGTAYPVGPTNASKHTNLTDGTSSDGRLHFEQTGVKCDATPTDAPGHFDKGQMAFKHSLSRIRVIIKKNTDSFTSSDAFAFATGTNIKLKNMPLSGTLNIKDGTWAASPTTGDITKMAPVTVPTSETGYEMATASSPTNAVGVYEAQMLPGFQFADATGDNVMEFTIDGNKYFVTNKEMMTALKNGSDVSGDATTLTTEQGKRYIFTITVGKKKIDAITATIAPWVNVTADNMDLDNSHVKFTFKSATGTDCGIDDIKFYKYEQELDKVYTDNSYSAPASDTKGKAFDGPATLSGSGSFSTSWYYNDNKTAYHFRTLNAKAAGAMTSDKKSFIMAAGETATTDYHWGAPMINSTDTKLAYDKDNGFVANVDKGVVSATKETDLTIQELHMMSNIVVDLKTVTGDAAIDVTDAEVTITNLYTTASVDMGTGKITATGDLGNNTMTCGTDDKNTQHTYSVIPQDLNRGSGEKQYVGITIKTKDNNEYYIIADLSAIIANTVDDQRNQTQGQAIKTWFPGHTYTYTFTLSKKKIEVITATVANWVNVVAANTDLDLEK